MNPGADERTSAPLLSPPRRRRFLAAAVRCLGVIFAARTSRPSPAPAGPAQLRSVSAGVGRRVGWQLAGDGLEDASAHLGRVRLTGLASAVWHVYIVGMAAKNCNGMGVQQRTIARQLGRKYLLASPIFIALLMVGLISPRPGSLFYNFWALIVAVCWVLWSIPLWS